MRPSKVAVHSFRTVSPEGNTAAKVISYDWDVLSATSVEKELVAIFEPQLKKVWGTTRKTPIVWVYGDI